MRDNPPPRYVTLIERGLYDAKPPITSQHTLEEGDGRLPPGGRSHDGHRHDHVRVNVGSRGHYSSAKALTPVVTTTTYCLPFGAM
jgi:hypothetical protein